MFGLNKRKPQSSGAELQRVRRKLVSLDLGATGDDNNLVVSLDNYCLSDSDSDDEDYIAQEAEALAAFRKADAESKQFEAYMRANVGLGKELKSSAEEMSMDAQSSESEILSLSLSGDITRNLSDQGEVDTVKEFYEFDESAESAESAAFDQKTACYRSFQVEAQSDHAEKGILGAYELSKSRGEQKRAHMNEGKTNKFDLKPHNRRNNKT